MNDNKFFIHEIKRTNNTIEKGIVVKDTYDEAKQGYHAYLGAYAYGNNAEKHSNYSPKPYTINDDEAYTDNNGDKSCNYSFNHNGEILSALNTAIPAVA